MRKLTINRHPTFVNSVLAMQVFAEDRVNGSEIVCGVPCRCLGDLPSGTRVDFEIDDSEQMIFVLPITNIKKKNHEFFLVPSGTEDVEISGKCYYNPHAGNPFRFDNNTDEEALRLRKRASRIGILKTIALILLTMLVIRVITFFTIPKEKVFTAEELSITLTSEFEETNYDGYLTAFETRDVVVTVYRESFEYYPELEEYSLNRYSSMLVEMIDGTYIPRSVSDGDMIYVEYSSPSVDDENEMIYTRIYLYKTDDAFWEVEFSVWQDNLYEMKDDLSNWAKTVSFAE